MVYIDSEYCCHVDNPDGALREVKTEFFNGKCATLIEGYRFVPDGESWINPEGTSFPGEMIAPWKDIRELEAAQTQYERMMEEAAAAYREGVDSV